MAKTTKKLTFVCDPQVPDLNNTTILQDSKNSVNKFTNASTAIPNAYLSDPLLKNKVTAVGALGWQKYVLEDTGNVNFTIRGACGGFCSGPSFSINASTGAKTGSGNIGGRGAKLKASGKFKAGTIFYIAVGQHGCGWYRAQSTTTITGGGGGASVVLVDNPQGKYTFAQNNRKVDVLLVAGGGGGAVSWYVSQNYFGKDASYNDGTTTNGGTAPLQTTGGAGLTGNGTGSDTSYFSKSLISGGEPGFKSVTRTGGFPGGGAGYSSGGGGGGGAGYSGGNSKGVNGQAEGGTSYINQEYLSPISRGYATYAEDGINPWYANGSVVFEISTGRDPEKRILAQDSEGYKYFNGDSLIGSSTTPDYSWKLLPTQAMPELATYDEYGTTEITSAVGLSGEVKFLVMSPNAQESITIDGHVNGAIVVQNTAVSVSDVSIFKSFSVLGTMTNVDIRFAVSKNQGASWQTYLGGQWVNIDINSKSIFQQDGYELSKISTIPVEDWNTYKPATLNFAFCITQNGSTTATILNNIKAVVDLVGSWRHFKENEATYEYVSDSAVKVTFLQPGNYKVNYLDSLNSGESSGSE